MLLKPPLFLVVAVSIGVILSFYNLYGFWFDIDNHHKRNQKRIENLHSHYPFRGYTVNLIKNKKAWTFQGRAMGTFNTLVLFIADCFLIFAFIFGK